MGRNTSISLGRHFETFIEEMVTIGRYQNASEVKRAELKLLEEEENRVTLLKAAIAEGINSRFASDFDPQEHLRKLKATKKKSNGFYNATFNNQKYQADKD